MNRLLDENSTFLELVDAWFRYLVRHDYSKSTRATYAAKIEHLLPEIGHKKLHELTREELQHVFVLIEKANISPNTINNIYTITKKVVNFAIQLGIMKDNVTANVVLPKRKPYVPKVYRKFEVRRLLTVSENSELEIPINLAVSLGLRRGEILSLRWKDIDFQHNTIHVNKSATAPDRESLPKSESSIRVLKLPKKLQKTLQNHFLKQKTSFFQSGITHDRNAFIFCKDNATKYKATALSKMFKKFLIEHKLPLIRFHDLRHTYATIAHNNGMPVKHLSRSLGHSTPAITVEKYVHL